MKNKPFIISSSLIVGMILLASQSFAKQLPCKEQHVETIYLYNVITQPIKRDFNEPLQEYLKAINAISSKLELKEFNIATTDVSASRSSEPKDVYDYSISVSITFLKDTRAFTQFMKKLIPMGGSSSVAKKCL